MSAFRRRIVCLCWSVLCGSSLPVSVVPSLVALYILVVVLFFFGLLCLVNSWGDDDGRYLQCEFVFCGKSFRVCCIYAPNRNPACDQFFDDLRVKVDPSVPTILCGDFNAVFDRSVDRFGSDPSDLSRESFSSLQDLFDACCTVDIWRYLHPSSSGFS